MNCKRILVTGGCGFIGSGFINWIIPRHPEWNIYNLDTLYYCASLKNIEHDSPNYHFIQGNLCSYDLIRHVLNDYQIDTVIHFAAQSHVQNSFSESLQYTRDNVLGTHTLLEACRVYGKIQRFIHVSTDEVYGESLGDDLKTEKSLLCPTNPYAATKAAAEMIVMSYYRSYSMPIIVTRGNNVYGERQYPEKLIPKFICLLQDDLPCTIQGTGENLRAFIHVDDVVRAFETILLKGMVGEIYNIGSTDEYTVLQIAHRLIHKLKPGEPMDRWITRIPDRNFNDYRYDIDSLKLRELGWSPQISFDEGLQRTVAWYLTHPGHWESVSRTRNPISVSPFDRVQHTFLKIDEISNSHEESRDCF